MRRRGRNLTDSGVCEPVMMRKWYQSDDMPRAGAASTLSVERHAVKFHSVIYQTKAEIFRDLPLKLLQFGIHEFNDISCFHVNQVIVMRFGCSFVARATVAEIMTFQNARFLEQADGAVDRGNG